MSGETLTIDEATLAREQLKAGVRRARTEFPTAAQDLDNADLPGNVGESALLIGERWSTADIEDVLDAADHFNTLLDHPAISHLPEAPTELDQHTATDETALRQRVAQLDTVFSTHDQLRLLNGSGPALDQYPRIQRTAATIAHSVIGENRGATSAPTLSRAPITTEVTLLHQLHGEPVIIPAGAIIGAGAYSRESADNDISVDDMRPGNIGNPNGDTLHATIPAHRKILEQRRGRNLQGR